MVTFKGKLNPKIDFSPFEHLGVVEQLYEVFLSCSKNFDVLWRIDKIWAAAQYVISAVVFDVGYDTRMIKTRKTMVNVRLLAAVKEKQLRKI